MHGSDVADVRLSSGGYKPYSSGPLRSRSRRAFAISGTPVGLSLTSSNNGETKRYSEKLRTLLLPAERRARVRLLRDVPEAVLQRTMRGVGVLLLEQLFGLTRLFPTAAGLVSLHFLARRRATPSLSPLNPRTPRALSGLLPSDQYSPDSGDRDSAFVRLPMRSSSSRQICADCRSSSDGWVTMVLADMNLGFRVFDSFRSSR